ncbi:MAG: DUF6046 domain-containing protein [Prevotellaceae bacterium]|jgi:hypothetical protein|nr:DUF6046 domain-containing protein [Prevotellaceae bacterium]
MDSFKIEDIYTWLASYKGLPFPVNISGYLNNLKGKWGDQFSGSKWTEIYHNLYGRPIIMPVSIGGIVLGSGEAGHISLQPLVVTECVKRIVKTPVAGGSYPGTVKEFINFDDYKVRIYGVVVNPKQKEYPSEQVEILKGLWAKNEALKFVSKITSSLFTHVVIENMRLDELKRAPGVQAYELQCVSDGVQEAELLMVTN